MIISPGRNYIFVHIPKTGGTSMALALEARAMADDILIGDTPKALRRRKRANALPLRARIWKHMRLADLEGYLGPDDFEKFFVFTLVRNPWDRLVSYYFWLRDQSFDHPAVGSAKIHDFSAFLRQDEIQKSLMNDAAVSYVSDAQGVDHCNAYIRLERFKDDSKPLERHLGFDIELPQSNPSKRDRDYRRYYDAESAGLIGRIFAQDIESFGYRFD